jgi:hypothetical protein
MKRRRPNTQHWQLLEKTCRVISRRGWRRVAARLLYVERKDLRNRFDREDLSGPEIDFLHASLKRGIERHLAGAEAAILHIARTAAAVRSVQSDRLEALRREVEAAELAEAHAKMMAFERAFFADLLEA